MGKFFYGILIYYSVLGFLLGSNHITTHPNLSKFSFFYGVLLLANGLWAWKSKKETEVNYFIWIFSSLVFWMICLWNTGKLGSPYLFFSFLLAFHSAFLKGIRHFIMTLVPLLIGSLLFLFFEGGGDTSLYSDLISSNKGREIFYKIFL